VNLLWSFMLYKCFMCVSSIFLFHFIFSYEIFCPKQSLIDWLIDWFSCMLIDCSGIRACSVRSSQRWAARRRTVAPTRWSPLDCRRPTRSRRTADTGRRCRRWRRPRPPTRAAAAASLRSRAACSRRSAARRPTWASSTPLYRPELRRRDICPAATLCWRRPPTTRVDRVITGNAARYNCESTAVRLPFDCSSTALRPMANLRCGLRVGWCSAAEINK